MHTVTFYKYQGAGNDFILIDNRQSALSLSEAQILQLCDRRFGIGADGLMLLENQAGYDFKMVYYNADGRESSMCGNGGRCIAAFAHWLKIIGEQGVFMAIDGEHEVKVINSEWIDLKMIDVQTVEHGDHFYFLNTGSPHYVAFVDEVAAVDVVKEGKAIRYNDRFRAEGTNVNFTQRTPEGIAVVTYERGVEDETLACGTGVTAAALAYHLQFGGSQGKVELPIRVKGGELAVRFQATSAGFEDIWLCGPAVQVFAGEISLNEG
jgi:diaminopimelate epimerase